MEIIEMTRELARAIQCDERYLRLESARKLVEDDAQLQADINEFNQKRYDLSIEAAKENRDQEKLNDLNTKVRDLYASITANEKMEAYNDAQDEFDDMFNFVNHILQMSANGADPYSVDGSSMVGGCGGSCESCGGCH